MRYKKYSPERLEQYRNKMKELNLCPICKGFGVRYIPIKYKKCNGRYGYINKFVKCRNCNGDGKWHASI